MMVFHGKLYDARMTEHVRAELPDWIRTLAASRPFGANGVNLNPLVLS